MIKIFKKNSTLIICGSITVVCIFVFVSILLSGKYNASTVVNGNTTTPVSYDNGVWGTISDTSGNPMAGVQVIVGNVVYTTDANGFYSIFDLAQGIYPISFFEHDKPFVASSPKAATVDVVSGVNTPHNFQISPLQ